MMGRIDLLLTRGQTELAWRFQYILYHSDVPLEVKSL